MVPVILAGGHWMFNKPRDMACRVSDERKSYGEFFDGYWTLRKNVVL